MKYNKLILILSILVKKKEHIKSVFVVKTFFFWYVWLFILLCFYFELNKNTNLMYHNRYIFLVLNCILLFNYHKYNFPEI